MINIENSLILIIDIQEKLVNMLQKDTISNKAAKLLNAAKILDIPSIVTEQYPKGLGATVNELKQEATNKTIFFEKTSFSACRENGFKDILEGFKRKNILICGIEAHVCVYQTAADLITQDYEVHLFQDIISSRNEFELNISVEKMKSLGANMTSFEIVLFELLKTSKHPNFKEIQTLIK
ncbi:MAG TPA: isochorismatase family protein [Candidatus Gastranaerophilales bacterium]|nr:isochorismatase family protein [Candidatus Gastranaerophilales bacterium]